jgi:hypothetical protein
MAQTGTGKKERNIAVFSWPFYVNRRFKGKEFS